MTGAIPNYSQVLLPPLPTGWQLVKAAALADGSLALLATDVDLEREHRTDATGRWLGRPGDVAAGAEARLLLCDNGHLTQGPAFKLETPYPIFDRFDDGRWLVVAARTDGEPNARVLGADGHLLARLMLGDGIEYVGIDKESRIWVGWFDEGIGGNKGWRVDGLNWPPSASGIGLFTADGQYRQLPTTERNGWFVDCYLMNVLGDSVWACLYADFPILHILPDRRPLWWSNTIRGARALAVSEGHALLAGGYRDHANRLSLVSLGGDGNGEAASIVATWRLPLVQRLPPLSVFQSEHFPWQRPTLLTGRGDTIHLVQDSTWYRWRVSDAMAATAD